MALGVAQQALWPADLVPTNEQRPGGDRSAAEGLGRGTGPALAR